jgi:hypothetical protein
MGEFGIGHISVIGFYFSMLINLMHTFIAVCADKFPAWIDS